MKADMEITTVTGNSFCQISASLREIAEHLKALVTPLATKMTLEMISILKSNIFKNTYLL